MFSRFVFPDGTAFVSLNPGDRDKDRDTDRDRDRDTDRDRDRDTDRDRDKDRDRDTDRDRDRDRDTDRGGGGLLRHPLKPSEESNRRSSSAGMGGITGRGSGLGVGSDGRGEKPRTPYLDLRGVRHSHDTETESERGADMEREKERDKGGGWDGNAHLLPRGDAADPISVTRTGGGLGVGVAALSPRIAARMVPQGQGVDRSWGAGRGNPLRGNTRSPLGGGENPLVSGKTGIQRMPSTMQEREREREGASKGVSPSLTRNNSNSSSHANPYEDDFEILEGDDDDLEVEVGEDSEVMWAQSDPEFDIDAVLRKNR